MRKYISGAASLSVASLSLPDAYAVRVGTFAPYVAYSSAHRKYSYILTALPSVWKTSLAQPDGIFFFSSSA